MFTDSFLSLHSSCLPAIPLSSFSPISSPSYFQSSLFSAPFPLLLALEINVLCMQTISISLNHFFSFGSIRCMCAAVVARLYSLLFHSILRALGTFCTTVVVPCFTQRGIDAFVCVCASARVICFFFHFLQHSTLLLLPLSFDAASAVHAAAAAAVVVVAGVVVFEFCT